MSPVRVTTRSIHRGPDAGDVGPLAQLRPAGGNTCGEVLAAFLQFKHNRIATGEVSLRMYAEYKRVCSLAAGFMGRGRPVAELRPTDFESLRAHMAQTVAATGLGTYIRMVRSMFRWAWHAEMIDKPLRYGGLFEQPSKSVIRRSDRRRQTYEASEVRALIEAAPPGSQMLCFVLLGINCAYGQTDCAELTSEAAAAGIAESGGGLLRFDRPKTGVERAAVLWPQTRAALQAAARTGGADPRGPAFTTKHGNPWVRAKAHRDPEGRIERVTQIDSIGLEFKKLATKAGVANKGFYALRRTFRTVADEAGDQHAIARVMGHLLPGMAGIYVRRIERWRLEKVVNYVRAWLDAHGGGPA